MEKVNVVDVIYFSFSNVFDKVLYDILIGKFLKWLGWHHSKVDSRLTIEPHSKLMKFHEMYTIEG